MYFRFYDARLNDKVLKLTVIRDRFIAGKCNLKLFIILYDKK